MFISTTIYGVKVGSEIKREHSTEVNQSRIGCGRTYSEGRSKPADSTIQRFGWDGWSAPEGNNYEPKNTASGSCNGVDDAAEADKIFDMLMGDQ